MISLEPIFIQYLIMLFHYLLHLYGLSGHLSILETMGCNCSSDYDEGWIENLDEKCDQCNCPLPPDSLYPVSVACSRLFVPGHCAVLVHILQSQSGKSKFFVGEFRHDRKGRGLISMYANSNTFLY